MTAIDIADLFNWRATGIECPEHDVLWEALWAYARSVGGNPDTSERQPDRHACVAAFETALRSYVNKKIDDFKKANMTDVTHPPSTRSITVDSIWKDRDRRRPDRRVRVIAVNPDWIDVQTLHASGPGLRRSVAVANFRRRYAPV